MKSALVVVSHYNAWGTEPLIALLDQITQTPAGYPFRCRVVVNQGEPKTLELPARFADVEVLYRENTGYNIGAWDHGWRQEPLADFYLFLQEECQILRAGWLKIFIDQLSNPKVGLVGESMFYSGHSWRRTDYYWKHIVLSRGPEGPGEISVPDVMREMMARRGIPPGKSSRHLQSLVLASRRDVLEAMDGFMIGRSYAHAIGAEVSISKHVEALGFRVRQVGIKPFRYILHPQWQHLRVGVGRVLFRWVEPFLPLPVGNYFHIYPRWHRRVLGEFKRSILKRLPGRPEPTTKA